MILAGRMIAGAMRDNHTLTVTFHVEHIAVGNRIISQMFHVEHLQGVRIGL